MSFGGRPSWASVVRVELATTAHRSVRTIPSRVRGRSTAFVVVLAVGVLGACGGGDDDDDAATTSTSAPVDVAPASTTTIAATTTTTPTPTATSLPPLVLVTDGATLVVANASGINGAAGRMTDALAAVGFSTGEPGNSSEGQLNTTKVYYDTTDPAVLPVAESVSAALGGGDIQLLPLATPAPLQDPEIGDAKIVVAMGNDTADKSLDELQGRTAPDEGTADEGTADDSVTTTTTLPDS